VTGLRAGCYGVRIQAGARHFSLLQNVHTGSEAHSTAYSVGTGSFLPGVKRPGREPDHSSSSAEVKNQWNYISTPLHAFIDLTGAILAIYLHVNYWTDTHQN
jgi:hypothetical protein